MDKNITCPICGHKSIDRIGVILKAKAIHLIGFGFSELKHNGKCYYPKMKEVEEENDLIGFYCKACGNPYPIEWTKEIKSYCNYRTILNKLKK